MFSLLYYDISSEGKKLFVFFKVFESLFPSIHHKCSVVTSVPGTRTRLKLLKLLMNLEFKCHTFDGQT